jgi:hypothetical protein
MSNILIRGMEMPKEFDPDVYIELACGIDGKRYARLYNFHQGGLTEWREVVPVPPHGRLGDLDELYASLKKWLIQNRHSMTEATRVWIHGVLEGIAAAPTIIPAEEANDEHNN